MTSVLTTPDVLAGALAAAAVLAWPVRSASARLRALGGAGSAAAAGASSRSPSGPCGWVARVLARVRSVVPAGSRRPDPPVAGASADLLMDLVASGLRSGLSMVDAVGCASAVGGDQSAYLPAVVARLRVGTPAELAWDRPPPALVPLARAMVLAELSGAPAAAVVARAAVEARALARERVEQAAARLGVRLVLPLGLAVLPGFVLLSVVPIVLGLAGSVLRQPG